jgi:CheY-like chemotaxis protein
MLLRIVLVSAHALPPHQTGKTNPRSTEGFLRILIVDDYRPLAEAMAHSLDRSGHTVEIARDGLEGLRMFQAEGFDAVLSDWNMPRMIGPEMVMRILDLAPRTKVVMMSGDPSNKPPAGIKMLVKGYLTVHDVLAAFEEAHPR